MAVVVVTVVVDAAVAMGVVAAAMESQGGQMPEMPEQQMDVGMPEGAMQ